MRRNKLIIGCLSALIFCSFRTDDKANPIEPLVINGVFRVNKVIAENFRGQSLFTKYFINAIFSNDTLGAVSFQNRMFGGSVGLNNNTISYYDGFKIYIDTTLDLSEARGFNWVIGGSSAVDSFSYVNAKAIPSFDYSNLILLSTIDTAQNLTFQLNHLSLTDSVSVTFSRADSVTRPPFIIKKFGTEGNVFVIDKKLIQQYAIGQDIYLQIGVNNYNFQTISGKNYYFINTFEYRKKVTITGGE